MKILITGYKGFIGQNLVNKLQNKHELVLYEWGENFPDLSGVEWAMHIGAISSTTERNVEKIMKQNYYFSIELFEKCKQHGINFQWSSSASIYGMGKNFSESAPPDPRNPYAWTKYLFEKYVEMNPGNIVTHGFRYFNVWGPHEDHKGNQASPYHQFKTQADTDGKVKVFEGSEHYKRDFVHVDKVVEVHERFLDVKESGIWNVGSGTPTSFLDIAKLYNVPVEIVPMPELLRGNYQEYTCADISKLTSTIDKFCS